MVQQIEKSILIHAPTGIVWEALTNCHFMGKWMGEPDMELEIITDWQVGGPIVIKGFHHVKFENLGTVLEYVPDNRLKYDYVSSISRLPYDPVNRTSIEFQLKPLQDQTSLTLILSNFPTVSILKHVNFYWNGTLEVLRRMIEETNLIGRSPNHRA